MKKKNPLVEPELRSDQKISINEIFKKNKIKPLKTDHLTGDCAFRN